MSRRCCLHNAESKPAFDDLNAHWKATAGSWPAATNKPSAADHSPRQCEE